MSMKNTNEKIMKLYIPIKAAEHIMKQIKGGIIIFNSIKKSLFFYNLL